VKRVETHFSRSRGSPSVTEYDAVLFDSDGVLVEPPARETQIGALEAAFRELGVENPDKEHLHGLAGGTTLDRLRSIASAYDLDPERLWDARERCDERSQFEAFRAGDRGTYDDVAAIRDLPKPRGVVSNNHHSTIEFKLDFFDLGPLFDTYYGREMTVESIQLKKPNTHYVDRAIDDLGATSALYVGDSESDVVAAERAGLDSVFLRRDHSRDVELSTEPTHEAQDLNDVVSLAD
jgi:HAD superfamily hydrolase (TIGR01549 family)